MRNLFIMIAVAIALNLLTACGEEPTVLSSVVPEVEVPEQPSATTTSTDTTCRGEECCGYAGSQWDSGLERCVNGYLASDYAPKIEFVRWPETYVSGWSGALGAFQIQTKVFPMTVSAITIETTMDSSNMPFSGIHATLMDYQVVSDIVEPNPTPIVRLNLEYTTETSGYTYLYLMADIPQWVHAGEFTFDIAIEGATEKGPVVAVFPIALTIQ